MEKNVNAGEIDLLELGARFLNALRQNLVLTIVLPLAGLITALVFSYRSESLYESGMLIETSLLSDSECRFLLNELNKVSEFPGITPEVADHVKNLRYEIIKNDVITTADKTADDRSVYLQVTATVSQKDIFPPLQALIVKFINESEPAVRHRRERERFYSSMVMKIDTEIAAMQAVKDNVDSRTLANYLDPSELYKATVALFKEKTEYEIKLEGSRAVHLVKGFDSLTIDAKLNKVIVAMIGFVLGFAVLSLILFIRFFVRYYNTYRATH
jgi:hypothetical protein